MLDTLIPKLTLTFASAASVLLLLLLTRRHHPNSLLWLGPPFFLVIILAGAIESNTGEQFIEAAKYSIFPLMALIVASPTNRDWLISKRPILIYSGIGAMAAQGAIILLHIGSTDTKYGVGEQLGFATQNPHELALIGATVAVACLVSIRDVRWRMLGAIIAVTPALGTGVRSALVGTVVALLVLAIRARLRPSVLLAIVVLCAAIAFSGIGTIITTRFNKDQAAGEFSSVDTAGSGRGGIWTLVLSHWSNSGADRLFVGDGLRSVERIQEQAAVKKAFVAQSDLVGVLVELGIFGLLAWLLTWLIIVKSGINWIVLLPLATYALINGSLEYVGATVFGIALAGACISSIRSSQDAKETSSERLPTTHMRQPEPVHI